MIRTVTVEELREKLDEVLTDVESGSTVTVVRDGKEIGTLSPAGLRIVQRGVPYPFRDFDWGPRPKNLKTDPAELIIEERERERERSGKKHSL